MGHLPNTRSPSDAMAAAVPAADGQHPLDAVIQGPPGASFRGRAPRSLQPETVGSWSRVSTPGVPHGDPSASSAQRPLLVRARSHSPEPSPKHRPAPKHQPAKPRKVAGGAAFDLVDFSGSGPSQAALAGAKGRSARHPVSRAARESNSTTGGPALSAHSVHVPPAPPQASLRRPLRPSHAGRSLSVSADPLSVSADPVSRMTSQEPDRRRSHNRDASPETEQPRLGERPVQAPAQAQEEVTHLDLVRLLENMFLAYAGSLDAAFQWLDFASTGIISRMSWDLGMAKLPKPDVLRSIKPARIFSAVARNGQIDIEAWQDFFNYQSDLDMGAASGQLTRTRTGFVAFGRMRSVDDAESSVGGRCRVANSRTLAPRRRRLVKRNTVDELTSRAPAVPSLQSILEPDEHDGFARAGDLTRMNRDSAGEPTDLQQAEAQQLEEEIQSLNLSGVQALAYILTAKLGSLDKAFAWLDYNSRGTFARVQWETGLKVLHIDIKKVTGLAPNKFFVYMDKKCKGAVSKKAWDQFFQDYMDADLSKVLSDLDSKQPLGQRAQKKLTNVWRRRHGSHKIKSVESDDATRSSLPVGRDPSPEVVVKPSRPPKARDRAQPSRPGTTDAVPERAGRKGSKASKAEKSIKEFKLSHHDATLTNQQNQHVTPPSTAPLKSVDDNSSDLFNAKASLASTSSRLVDPNTGLDEEDFREVVRNELCRLGPDEFKGFERVKRADRNHVEEVARELGFWCGYCGPSHGGHLLVIHEGDRAALIRSRLLELGTGERALFEDLPLEWWMFARQVAEGMGLLVPPVESFEDSNGRLEIWNLNGSIEDFAAAVRRQLQELAPGEVLTFPAALNASQFAVVGEIATELGYTWHGSADGLKVGNLNEFKERVRQDLAKLAEGESCCFEQGVGGYSQFEIHVVRLVAQELGQDLSVEDLRSKTQPGITVTRRVRYPKSLAQDAQVTPERLDRDAMKQRVAAVFKMYASGRHNRETVFLRKPDLQRFAEDARSAHRDRDRIDLLDVMPELEEVYDEIYELQVDMGSRVHNGLSLDFFQVFLSKTAGVFGWSLISMMFALLEMSDAGTVK